MRCDSGRPPGGGLLRDGRLAGGPGFRAAGTLYVPPGLYVSCLGPTGDGPGHTRSYLVFALRSQSPAAGGSGPGAGVVLLA